MNDVEYLNDRQFCSKYKHSPATLNMYIENGYLGEIGIDEDTGFHIIPDDTRDVYKTNGRVKNAEALRKAILDAARTFKSIHWKQFPLVPKTSFNKVIDEFLEAGLITKSTTTSGIVVYDITDAGIEYFKADPKTKVKLLNAFKEFGTGILKNPTLLLQLGIHLANKG